MKKEEHKIFYLTFHKLLTKRYGVNRIISRKQVYCDLGKHFLVPQSLKDVAIFELEQMGLVKKKDRNSIIILNSEIDIDKDKSIFYKKAGFF